MLDLGRQLERIAQPIVLGTNSFGWTTSCTEAHTILDLFAERDPVLLDTAEMYKSPDWRGPEDDHLRSEVIIGEWLSNRRPNAGQVLVASKVGGDRAFPGLSPENIQAGAIRSRERLGVEAIDLFYAHKDDPSVPLDETIAAFEDLRHSGVIRAVGLSTFSADRMVEWMESADRLGAAKPVGIMQRYNLVERKRFERDYVPVIEKYGLFGFTFFALASGFLSGKFSSFEQVRTSERSKLTSTVVSEAAFGFLERFRKIADDASMSMASLATAWAAAQPHVAHPVLGVRDATQLAQTLSALREPIAQELVELLDRESAQFA